MTTRVLLTGITGYIGQHCAAELLRQGFEVLGTIRSRAKADATKADLSKVASTEHLVFAEADLMSDAGWDEAMKVVRSGVTSPRWTARPASISSEAITRSTSPGKGMRASTGWRPSSGVGNIST